MTKIHLDLGRDIYIGWSAGVLALVGSVCLFISSCGNDEEEYETGYQTTNYNQGQPYNQNSTYADSQTRHV